MAAPPVVHIDAVVGEDLRTVRGTMTLPASWVPTLVDPLDDLPEPPNDLHLLRTYPGRPSRGEVRWQVADDGLVTFTTELPRRYDDLGWTREGLMANGAWYPQPSPAEDALPTVRWEVTVQLPEGRVGALGDHADQGSLSWTALADRVPLAVLRRGRLTQLGGDHWSVDLLTPGRARGVLVRELVHTLDATASEELPIDGTIVEGPLRRRLARPGPGMLYLSDRAFRLTPPLQRFHRVTVARGLVAASVDQPDPFLREVAGAGVALSYAESLQGIDADDLLGAFSWIPQIHWLLANRRMPFYAEVLERVHPSDPIRDDLAERLEPHHPATFAVIQAEDGHGEGSGVVLGEALARGRNQEQAEAAAGLPVGWLDRWRVPVAEQDYQLHVDRETAVVLVKRDAPDDAPPETVLLRIDDRTHTLPAVAGEHRVELDTTPRKVVLDPVRHLAQTSRVGDSWPPRYTFTLSAGISSINLTRGQIFGAASGTVRRTGDTHNLVRGTLYNAQSDLVGVSVSWMHQEGPQLAGAWARPHRWTVWLDNSLLDPRFADTDGLQLAVGGGTAYAFDDRVYADFPLRGKRIGVSVSGGLVPGLAENWVHAGPYLAGVIPLHPRHALALFGKATLARANVAHRKLALGGASNMRSLPAIQACPPDEPGEPCQQLADARAIGAFEYRVAPLRNVSVPLPLAWGSELQLAAGLETVLASVRNEPAWALGATFGLTGVADILGAEPYLGGLTIGWPLAWSDALAGVDQQGWPEIYLRWSQEF